MLRREDTKDWVRFVVTKWSPSINNVANGWETTLRDDKTESSHAYWAYGQLFNSQGQALSGYYYFNSCALGGTCGTSGSDGVGFGKDTRWTDKTTGVYGGGYDGTTKARFYWGTSTEVTNTRFTYWYRPATPLLDTAQYLWNFDEPSGTRYDSKQRVALSEVGGSVLTTAGYASGTFAANIVGSVDNSTNNARLQFSPGVFNIGIIIILVTIIIIIIIITTF